ncbi:hypothetical protein KF840_18890 [bacterium]|nr:hypothetical protein [bacterium]
MPAGGAMPLATSDPFRALAAEIERLPPVAIAIDETPPRRRRVGPWALVLLAAVAVAAAALLSFGGGERDVAPVPVLVPPSIADNACAARAAIIMQAVAAHVARTGAPPSSLAALSPAELTVPPVDPVSGDPYIYELQPGGAVTLSCPTAPARD